MSRRLEQIQDALERAILEGGHSLGEDVSEVRSIIADVLRRERETGWLIELPLNGQHEWLKAYRHEQGTDPFLLSPTHNASEALRFARRCDAETFLHNLVLLHPHWSQCFVTDHEWMSHEQ